MDEILSRALACMGDVVASGDVIPWGSPILSFGDPAASRFATLGLNPSNVEFADRSGNEIAGSGRRFETLATLGLSDWTRARREHRERMLATYRAYFDRNPYRRWFDPLDTLIAGTGSSYYSAERPACHLDLVPFATSGKWGSLDREKKAVLIDVGTKLLGAIVRDSVVEVVVVNGVGVLTEFERSSDARIDRVPVQAWDLVRSDGTVVRGWAYRGRVDTIGTVALRRSVTVIGYNVNVQSSFGVTNIARSSIASWIARETRRA